MIHFWFVFPSNNVLATKAFTTTIILTSTNYATLDNFSVDLVVPVAIWPPSNLNRLHFGYEIPLVRSIDTTCLWSPPPFKPERNLFANTFTGLRFGCHQLLVFDIWLVWLLR